MAILKAYTYIETVDCAGATFYDVAHNLGTTTGIALAGQKIMLTSCSLAGAGILYLANVTADGFRVNAAKNALVRVQVEAVHSIQQ